MERVLTRKGEATRQRIIEGAAALVIAEGGAVGLDRIRQATGTSGSQLLHYFPGGKAQLMLAVAAYEADQTLEEQRPLLDSLDSWEAWSTWAKELLASYDLKGSQCSISGLMSQLDMNTPEFQAIVVNMYRRWEDALVIGIRHLQSAGVTRRSLDVEDAAAAILAGIQGGIIMMLASGSTNNLRAALAAGLAGLRR